MPQKLQEAVDTMAPQPRGHRVLDSQSPQCRACRRMLRSEEEVVMLVEQAAVEGNQSLPLVIVELAGGVALRGLVIDHLNALALEHFYAGVDALDFGH